MVFLWTQGRQQQLATFLSNRIQELFANNESYEQLRSSPLTLLISPNAWELFSTKIM